jgi:hypothetical protein
MRGFKMPTIICSYCQYVGQGTDYDDRIADVEQHEEICPEKAADVMAKQIDNTYENHRG